MFKLVNRLLILFTIINVAPIFGETIGNVEYQLPTEAKEWSANKQENDVAKAVLYAPKNNPAPLEFFAVGYNKSKIDLKDTKALEKGYQDANPGKQLTFKVLNQTADSVLIEWTLKEPGQEETRGWTRIFSSDQGTVMMQYINQDPKSREQAKGIWLPVLEKATSAAPALAN